MSEYFSNAPTKASRMPVTRLWLALALCQTRVTAMIFGFHQSARKGVDVHEQRHNDRRSSCRDENT